VTVTDLGVKRAREMQDRPPLPAATCERIERERDFFNRSVAVTTVQDASLRVPQDLEEGLEREVKGLARSLEGKTVCDYGCGQGVFSCFLAQRGACVHSFDVSEAQVALARRAAQANRVAGRVFPEVMAGEYLAYPSNYFDLVFGNAVLHHVDIPQAAREIYRVLKPGGQAVFGEPLGENRLLEWARRSALRTAKHRHSLDEHSLRYSEIQQFGSLFDRMSVRETRLLRMGIRLLEEFSIGKADGRARPWLGRWSARLERADDWLLGRYAGLRHLCQYVVLTVFKRGSGRTDR